MSKSLNFELGLSIIKAVKEVDKFVQGTNKKMGKLKTEITISRKNADKDAAKKEKEDYRIRLAQMKTEQEEREKAAQAEIKRWEEGKKAAKEANAVRVKAAADEKKANDAVQKSIDKNRESIRKAIEKESDERQKAFDKRQSDLKKNADAVKKQQDKIADIRIASNARVDRMEIAAGGATLVARKKYALELERILATSNDRSLEDTRQMIRSLEAEYNKLNRMAIKDQNIQAAQMGGGLATRNIGRQVNLMFNLQQAIEDFSYAGMRGASNNLATMAAAMGGPAGIAAMAALAAYNIYQLGDSLGWFGKKVETTNKHLQDHLTFLRSLRDEEHDRRTEFSNIGIGESRTKRNEYQLELADLQNQQDQLKENELRARTLSELMKGLQAEMRLTQGGLGTAWWLGAGFLDGANVGVWGSQLSGVGDYSPQLQAYYEALNKMKAYADRIANQFPELGMSGEELIANSDKLVEDQEAQVREASNQQKLNKERMKDLRSELFILGNRLTTDRELLKVRNRLSNTRFSATGVNAESLPKLKRFMEERERFSQRENQRLEEFDQDAEARIKMIAKASGQKEAFEASKRHLAELTKQVWELEKSNRAAQELASTLGDVYNVSKDAAEEMKQLAREAEKAAIAAWDQVEAVKAAKLANQRSFESTVFGARNSILDKQAQEEIQNRQSQLGTVEGRQKYDEFWVKYMFGDSKRTQWLIKERAKLIGQFHSQAMQDIQTQVERERSKRADKLLNDRIGVLQDRSKSQTKAGDFQGSLSTLQEMQGLYLSAMGSAGSSAQMRSFLQRAEDVQKQMDAVHDKNIERETEAAEKATERAKQAQELLDQSLKTKEAIESLDPNANGALDKLLQMQNMLEQMRRDAEGIKMSLEGNGVAFNGFGPIPGGNQVAGVGGGNNITNINVASINTNAANAGSLVTDLNAQAKRKGIMVG